MRTITRTFALALLCILPLTHRPARAQTPPAGDAPKGAVKKGGARPAEDAAVDPRRVTAISLLTTLADEARGYQDQTARARVQSRAADALWETDQEKARALFRRAWEAAESGDKEASRRAEERRRQADPRAPAQYVQDPPNLRAEVLRLASKRDRALGEEFLTKLSDAAGRESQNLTINTGGNQPAQPAVDPENPPLEISQRLSLARQALEEGDTERALLYADKALGIVTTRGIKFLSLLREKDAAAADPRFMAIVQRAATDPSSDAITVSVLSSYVFTPFLTIVVRPNGSHSSQERDQIGAPNVPPQLRAAFMAAAAQILLRPIPPPDQDRTLAGRRGLYFTIARLLPLFDQHAPDFSPQLRAQLSALAPDAPESLRNGTDRTLTRGLVPEETQRDEGQEALESADRAATQVDRDSYYARAAQTAARKGDVGARDLADKIQDTEMRKGARGYVDFSLVNRAIQKGDPTEALRLARTGELTNLQRSWALTEIAGLMKKTDAKSAAEILDEAANEARRIGSSDANRARALFGVATRMSEVDRPRTWELVSEAVKAANSALDFSGEDAQIVSRLPTPHGTSTTNMTVDSFDVAGVFGQLAKDDIYRAVELAKNFTSEVPRAAATLAIARAVLSQKRADPRN